MKVKNKVNKKEKDWPMHRSSDLPLTLVCLFASFFLSLIPDSLTVTDSLEQSTNYPCNDVGRGQSTWLVQSPKLIDNGLQSSDLGKSSFHCWQLFNLMCQSLQAEGGGRGGGGGDTDTGRERERALQIIFRHPPADVTVPVAIPPQPELCIQKQTAQDNT